MSLRFCIRYMYKLILNKWLWLFIKGFSSYMNKKWMLLDIMDEILLRYRECYYI